MVDRFKIGDFLEQGGDGLAALLEGNTVTVALLVGLHGDKGIVS